MVQQTFGEHLKEGGKRSEGKEGEGRRGEGRREEGKGRREKKANRISFRSRVSLLKYNGQAIDGIHRCKHTYL